MALAYGDYENGILLIDLTHDEAVYLQDMLREIVEKEVEEAPSINKKIADRLYSYAHWQSNRARKCTGEACIICSKPRGKTNLDIVTRTTNIAVRAANRKNIGTRMPDTAIVYVRG